MSTINSQIDLDVLIIGGGISGLTTAWWLAQQGLRVQVWEKSSQAGGKIKTNHTDGFQTEQAASMIMNFKPEVDQFFSRSGLTQHKAKRLLQSENNRYLIHQGKLQTLPMTIARLFFSPMWSTQGKLRLLMEPFIRKANKDDETVSEFVSRRFGHEFLEKAMEPFIAQQKPVNLNILIN
ncbi:MAG: protoporphyrinogen oxidase [gamma proteobacterium symbiont of Bathyaustriella thionipta]|nr:protoporphyrinogen oxidase [gamma proteobacterium symbiont of Bathyaustriella thionipta]MCU7951665.1 protoporphyrinogen oxidase [gamma proteobacterium symbiont of Bathyaustriella thionipta]MCU7952229.1 protoporphyrinogen oxidase [gamma proteobacterium symbiont of Bathyaustriella thionipta]MCU7958261.1 protoporphyrinogen oxidase [gamma proteobacterium symbiont of Bathyaustriella thionipta]MCU7967682.1 protoporphyrinogen oxidase [gamma proteobacterium symbiont of Bathyaustriella thionipta]